MKLFIFGKEASQIRADARAAERSTCESHYLAEQINQRKQYASDKEDMRKAHSKEIKELELSLITHYEKEIRALREDVIKKDNQLKNSQEAWQLFKGVIPEIKNYSSVMETRAETNSMARARELAQAREIDQGLEAIQRKMHQITPDVDRLLSLDVVPQLIDKPKTK